MNTFPRAPPPDPWVAPRIADPVPQGVSQVAAPPPLHAERPPACHLTLPRIAAKWPSTPPSGRFVLVNGVDVYAVHGRPAGMRWHPALYAGRFRSPRWRVDASNRSPSGALTHDGAFPAARTGKDNHFQEFFAPARRRRRFLLRWHFRRRRPPHSDPQLEVRPFILRPRINMRMHHENGAFIFTPGRTAVRRLGLAHLRRRAGPIAVKTAGDIQSTPRSGIDNFTALRKGAGARLPRRISPRREFSRLAGGTERAGPRSFSAPGLDAALEAELAARKRRGCWPSRWAAAGIGSRAAFTTPLHRAADAYVMKRGKWSLNAHDHRGLSVVRRLGPRHFHRVARRALPRGRTGG